MPRKKKGLPAHIKTMGEAEDNLQRQQEDALHPEPSLAAGPSSDLPNYIGYQEFRRLHLLNLKTSVETALQPLPDEGTEDMEDYLPLQDGDMDTLPLPDAEMEDTLQLADAEDTLQFQTVEMKDDVPLSRAVIDEYKQKIRLMLTKAGYYANRPTTMNSKDAKEAKLKAETLKKLGPVVKQYKLLVNPSTKRSLLLQYPNRELGQEYRAASGQKPLELRIKPKTGIVEVDIPINTHANYDKVKGIEYGEAMRSSRVLQQGGSYGLAGGLGVGAKPPAKDGRRATAPEGPSQEKLLKNFEDADNKGHVMNKITLGGLIVPFKDGDPIYMIATFKGDTCTWTKLDAMVQLRPKFDHLDALDDQGKSTSRGGGADEEEATERPEREARAVNMAVKSAETNDELDMYGGMSETRKLLIAMRDEPWQRLKWIDQDDDESFDVYDENLVYQNPDNPPQLVSEMTNEQYLDAISCPRIDPTKQGENVMTGGHPSTVESNADGDEEELNLDDTEDDPEDGDDELTLPPGVVYPDLMMQIRVENAVRKICLSSQTKEAAQERILKQKVLTNSKLATWTFLFPGNKDHAYYEWRLSEERAGRGIEPEEDMA